MLNQTARRSSRILNISTKNEDNETNQIVVEKMPMRLLGNTGLQVSVVSFGFWATFGAKDDLKDKAGILVAKEILHICRQNGINYFENAESYGSPRGAAEEIMGKAIKALRMEYPNYWQRSQIIVSTKLFWGFNGYENQTGLSRKHIFEGIESSLKRLQLSYVDLVFCHRPDPQTPTETVVRAMTDIVRSGKAFYWGTSEWSAQQFTEAFWISKVYNLEPPMFEQPQYNLLHRERVEKEYFPLYKPPYNMGLATWSPLSSGLLSGKYDTETGKMPPNSRAAAKGYEFVTNKIELAKHDGTMSKVNMLKMYSKDKLDCTVAQLSIAWCIRNTNASTILLGATSKEQILENLHGVNIAMKMTQNDDQQIDLIVGTKPSEYSGFGGAGMRAWNRMEGLSEEHRMRVENYGSGGFPLPDFNPSI